MVSKARAVAGRGKSLLPGVGKGVRAICLGGRCVSARAKTRKGRLKIEEKHTCLVPISIHGRRQLCACQTAKLKIQSLGPGSRTGKRFGIGRGDSSRGGASIIYSHGRTCRPPGGNYAPRDLWTGRSECSMQSLQFAVAALQYCKSAQLVGWFAGELMSVSDLVISDHG